MGKKDVRAIAAALHVEADALLVKLRTVLDGQSESLCVLVLASLLLTNLRPTLGSTIRTEPGILLRLEDLVMSAAASIVNKRRKGGQS